MGAEREQWLGPGETARRLGVSPKALRVYGPVEIARLHQVVVLRDLGLSLRAIKATLGEGSDGLGRVLVAQKAELEARRARIAHALGLIDRAQTRLAAHGALSLDELATLTRETIVQSKMRAFEDRLQAELNERLPSEEARQARERLAAALKTDGRLEALQAQFKALLSEAAGLRAQGDPDSDSAKAMVRGWLAAVGPIERPSPSERTALKAAYRPAWEATVAKNSADELPFDPADIAFIWEVARRMHERGELD